MGSLSSKVICAAEVGEAGPEMQTAIPLPPPSSSGSACLGSADIHRALREARAARRRPELKLASSFSTHRPRRHQAAQGDGMFSSEDAAVVAEVERQLDEMTAWERIAQIYAWNQNGSRALGRQQWSTAGDAYVRALAYAQALSHHGPLIEAVAAWAPAAKQQSEVRRLCSEVYVGLASLQLQRLQAHTELSPGEREGLLLKAKEAATHALELDTGCSQALIHLQSAQETLDSLALPAA
mmetsp:Transcript_6668/g.18243  ORF Transcript_6668/g.18243 Transcript_6668/m.18243 type:complete len:239 (-) Transcript_6668:58-774(-)|eukprot:CAMPEP_0179106686 /NCGR_PEP_ID=MMETSP0796-20121207/49620_1 /TAXON_ID=73915 /ORGANISM="Pyrodinium bahamense, Strain pbaha01" /LENGTH=238 /DNA_ID=CAMNT_0020804729 /DNA_START=67 /DNA_END=783 /DNA_ORIENTATION=-